jgi:hypothetical protein
MADPTDDSSAPRGVTSEHEPPAAGKSARRRATRDVAMLAGPTDDGEGAHVLRLRGDELSVGEVRPMREGRDLRGQELVRLRQLAPERNLFEVETLHATGAAQRPQGPARVSNPGYRRNWDRVFKGAGRRTDDYCVN